MSHRDATSASVHVLGAVYGVAPDGSRVDVPSTSQRRLLGLLAVNAPRQLRTEWLADLVACDNAGFILSGPDLLHDGRRPSGWNLGRDPFWLECSVPGIFVAGDVRHRSVKRIASSVGEGSMAVQFVHQYLGGM